MVDLEQIEQWRTQLKDEPSSFARDLAHVLILEFERLHAAELASERRFAATQAALMRAQLAKATECSACCDVALRRAEERLRFSGARAARSTVGAPVVSSTGIRPRYA